MKTKTPVLDDVARLISSTTSRHDLGAICRVLDEIIQTRYGHRLFTVSRLANGGREIERLHSSNVEIYPLKGLKQKEDTVWGRVVYDEGRVLISRDLNDLRENFPDFEAISALGIRSMINIPVVWNGKVLGSSNVSHQEEGYFDENDEIYLKMLVGVVAPVIEEPPE